MNDHDGTRARSDAAFEYSRIEIVSFWTDVGENRLCAQGAYGAASGDERKRGHEHFVAGANSTGAKCEDQRVGAGGESRAVSNTAEIGDFRFQSGAFAAEDKLLRSEYALDGGSNLTANDSELGREIELRHRLRGRVGLRMAAHVVVNGIQYTRGRCRVDFSAWRI